MMMNGLRASEKISKIRSKRIVHLGLKQLKIKILIQILALILQRLISSHNGGKLYMVKLIKVNILIKLRYQL